MRNQIINIDAVEGLKSLPDNYVHTCVTSPPYWGLRDYGTASWEGGSADCNHEGSPMRTKANINRNTGTGNDIKNSEAKEFYKDFCGLCGAKRIDNQIGLESTPEEFVIKLTSVMREVKRVLRPDGTLWLNIGDSYAGSGRGVGDTKKTSDMQRNHHASYTGDIKPAFKSDEFKPKDLIGIPWLVAFALRADGWYLRQDIIWHKPNPMPESVGDRCTKAHEYIFLLTKSERYYYDSDSIKTKMECAEHDKRTRQGRKRFPTKLINGIRGNNPDKVYEWANKRSVWTVNTKPYADAHFATFPQDLIVDCIKAGSPEGGLVLDPFMGAGTTAVVSKKLNRDYIGFELNEKYIKIANKRLQKELGFFNSAA